MRFRKGKHRFVFVIPLFGIAIKFPFVRIFVAVVHLIKNAVSLNFKCIRSTWHIPIDSKATGGYKILLFGGIVANWRECSFFKETKHPFLQPTYFSCFGLFNIQKAGAPCLMRPNSFWREIYVLTDSKAWADKHHFRNPDNFCVDDDKLRILDYGRKETQGIVVEYGATIQDSFDFNFRWPEDVNVQAFPLTMRSRYG